MVVVNYWCVHTCSSVPLVWSQKKEEKKKRFCPGLLRFQTVILTQNLKIQKKGIRLRSQPDWMAVITYVDPKQCRAKIRSLHGSLFYGTFLNL